MEFEDRSDSLMSEIDAFDSIAQQLIDAGIGKESAYKVVSLIKNNEIKGVALSN